MLIGAAPSFLFYKIIYGMKWFYYKTQQVMMRRLLAPSAQTVVLIKKADDFLRKNAVTAIGSDYIGMDYR